jgi:tRNA pseudouridine55 synthase
MEAMDGVFVLDKAGGISSHDAVGAMRRIAGTRRIGHLGTLDPIATGVLPLVVGKATRLSQFYLGHDRAYEAWVRCGFATDSYDRAGQMAGERRQFELDPERIEEILGQFRGKILQTPPAVSAKKIGGVPAYKLARQQKPVELQAVEVEIYELNLLRTEGDRFQIHVRCSAGTYIRTLAHEVGLRLGCGAHVDELRRTAVGEFNLASARTKGELESLSLAGRLGEAIVPSEELLPELPAQRVDRNAAARIAQGRDFEIASFPSGLPARRVKAIGPDGRLLAIGELKLPALYHPMIVF